MRIYLAAAFVVLGIGPAKAAQPDIEIHGVVDCAHNTAPRQTDPNTHQDICVAPTSIVGGSDVTGVQAAATRAGNDALEVTLSEKASSTLLHYTMAHVGQKIAVLVDGKLVNAPVVLEPLMGRQFQISGLSKGEITALVERFKDGPPI
jgi:preprotein translocase subunit SecD